MNLYKRLRETGMGAREALWVSTTPLVVTSLPIIYSACNADFAAQPYESTVTLGYAIGGGAVLGVLTLFGCMTVAAANHAYHMANKKDSLDEKVDSSNELDLNL